MAEPHKNILSAKHINAIGALVVNCSKLDSVLTDLIAIFMDTHILCAVITVHHQQFANKVDSLKALMHASLSDSDEFKPTFDLINQAKAVADFRNTIVHAHWTVDGNGVTYGVRFEARGKFKRSKNPYTDSQIQARADEASALAEELASLRDYLRGKPKPRPRK